jgi:hypothetical protein
VGSLKLPQGIVLNVFWKCIYIYMRELEVPQQWWQFLSHHCHGGLNSSIVFIFFNQKKWGALSYLMMVVVLMSPLLKSF